MSWKIRHEGSPQFVEGLSLAKVVEGLQDGQWAPTDEVMGPTDKEWQSIDNHPALEEVAAEVEPPPRHQDDETRLDMNPLIDVCLVLLIFFILTMSYGAIEKLLDRAQDSGPGSSGQPGPKDVIERMIRVEILERNDQPIFNVQAGETKKTNVPLANLDETLKGMMTEDKKRNAMLIEYGYNVPHGIVIAVQDKAKGLGIEQVYYLKPKRL